MSSTWSPIALFCPEIQAHISRTWNCQPAWDVSAVYAQPDAWLSLPPELMTREKNGEKQVLAPVGVFWNRHLDRRFTVPYVHATRETPRLVTRGSGNPWKEWDILIRERDRILQENGLTVQSPALAVAKALADSFACDNFEKKGHCPAYPDDPRSLSSALDAVLYRSFCVGNALAFMAMADSCGFKTRTIGCGGHRVAEVLVDGRWHLVDSVGRHRECRGLDCFFKSSYHDSYLDPMGDHGDSLTPSFRQGLFGRPNGQYHFHDGTWGGTRTLRWSAVGAYALYPDNTRWGFKGGEEMPLVRRAGGFYPPILHSSDAKAFNWLTYHLVPDPVPERGPSRSYLYHPFTKGQVLRESFQLDGLHGMRCLRVTFTFAWSRETDFSAATGRGLVVRVGEREKSLAELGAWPPQDQGQDLHTVATPSGEMLRCVADLPADWFQPCAVNWISLHQGADTVLHVPCIPAALEPYIPPLWTNTRRAPAATLSAITPTKERTMSQPQEAIPVVMIRPTMENIPAHPLPAGFTCRWYQPGDGALWTTVWQAAEKWLQITPETFRKEFGQDDRVIGQRMFFIMDAQGRPVATSTAWFDNNWRGQAYGRVHWVAIIPEMQGQGLGKPLMSITLQRQKELGHVRSVLGTHNVRLPAINLYLYFGFVPEVVDAAQLAVWSALQPQLKFPIDLSLYRF